MENYDIAFQDIIHQECFHNKEIQTNFQHELQENEQSLCEIQKTISNLEKKKRKLIEKCTYTKNQIRWTKNQFVNLIEKFLKGALYMITFENEKEIDLNQEEKFNQQKTNSLIPSSVSNTYDIFCPFESALSVYFDTFPFCAVKNERIAKKEDVLLKCLLVMRKKINQVVTILEKSWKIPGFVVYTRPLRTVDVHFLTIYEIHYLFPLPMSLSLNSMKRTNRKHWRRSKNKEPEYPHTQDYFRGVWEWDPITDTCYFVQNKKILCVSPKQWNLEIEQQQSTITKKLTKSVWILEFIEPIENENSNSILHHSTPSSKYCPPSQQGLHFKQHHDTDPSTKISQKKNTFKSQNGHGFWINQTWKMEKQKRCIFKKRLFSSDDVEEWCIHFETLYELLIRFNSNLPACTSTSGPALQCLDQRRENEQLLSEKKKQPQEDTHSRRAAFTLQDAHIDLTQESLQNGYILNQQELIRARANCKSTIQLEIAKPGNFKTRRQIRQERVKKRQKRM